MKNTVSVILAGVGGQGILLASEILARTALLAGYQVKTNEVHGMAQRGGSVVAEIRYGADVYSPLVEAGTVTALASMEQLEALRYAHYLSSGGLAVVSKLSLVPVTVSAGLGHYPEDISERLHKSFPRLAYLSVEEIAEEMGNPRISNVVLLGALSTGLSLPSDLWEESIRLCVKPKFIDLNLLAFSRGRSLINSN